MASNLSFLISGVFALFGAAAHADYRASGNPGGVLSPDSARVSRNVAFVVTVVSACVGGALKAAGL